MKTIANAIKSAYFQFVNFIQNMPTMWFVFIWIALFCLALVCIVKFFKEYNGTQKQFVKVSMIVLALIFIACLVYITYLR